MRNLTLIVVNVLLCTGLGCARRSPAQKSAALVESGKELASAKQYAKASIQFRRAIQLSPGNAEAYFQLGILALTTQDLKLGFTALSKAAEIDPKHAGAQIKLAEILSGSGNPEVIAKAMLHARSALSLAPDNPDALRAAALAEFHSGLPDLAEKHLERALNIAPRHLEAAISLAAIRLKSNRIPAAEAVLQTAAASAPRSPLAARTLGDFYASTGKLAEAEKQLGRALALDPNDEPSLAHLAVLQRRRGAQDEAEKTYRRLAGSPDPEYASMLGEFYWTSDRRDKAVAEFKRLYDRNPEDRKLRSRLISAYLGNSQQKQADQVIDSVLKKNGKDTDALLRRGHMLLSSGKSAEAIKILREIIAVKQDSVQAHYELAAAYALTRQPKLQQQELDETLRLNPNLLIARLDLAQALITGKDGDSALALLDAAPAAQKNAPALVEQRIRALIAAQRNQEARRELDKVFAAGRAPALLFNDAMLKASEKQFAASRASLSELLRKAPGELRVIDALARTYASERHLDLAVAAVRQHVSELPKSAPAQFLLGRWLGISGDAPGAKTAFEQAKTLDPKFEPAFLALIEIALTHGNAASAENMAGALLARNPDDQAARGLLAQAQMIRGDKSHALDNYRKVVDQDPGNVEALNNMACLLADISGNVDEAMKYAQKAVELLPGNPVVEDTLGWLLYKKGLYPTAVHHLETAVARKPNAVREYHLAMTYSRMGDRLHGQKAYEAAHLLNPNLPEAAEAQAMLGAFAR